MRRALLSLAILATGCSVTSAENATSATSSALTSREAIYVDGELYGWVTHVDDGGGQTRIRLDGMGEGMYAWIKAGWNKQHEPKSGAIVSTLNGATRQRDFVDARIVGLSIEGWKGGSIVLQLDAKLGPSNASNIAPPPPPPPGTGMPTLGAPQCACNAVGITDVSFALDGSATATVTVPWQKPGGPSGGNDQPTLEFDSANGRAISFEIPFDGYEGQQQPSTQTLRDVEVIDARGAIYDATGRKLRAILIRAKTN